MISKVKNWFEYKRRLAMTIANLNYRIYTRESSVSYEDIFPPSNIEEFRIDRRIIEESLKKVSEKWENYYSESVYYALLSKSKLRLFFTRKSKLEKILNEVREEYKKV
jgi:hypothetical protein